MIFAIARKARTPKIMVVIALITIASSVFVKYSGRVMISDKGADIVAGTVKRSNLSAKDVSFQMDMSRNDKSASKLMDTAIANQLCRPTQMAGEKINKMPAAMVMIGGSRRKKLTGRCCSSSAFGSISRYNLKLN